MKAAIRIVRAGPLATLQDSGRFGLLAHGIGASGPMDRAAWERAGGWIGGGGTAVEFTAAGLGFVVEAGRLAAGFDGGAFRLSVNGASRDWPARVALKPGDSVEILPGPQGNYGYVRFDREPALAPVLGSRATNLTVGLGGIEGRALRAGDRLEFDAPLRRGLAPHPHSAVAVTGPIRFVWGLHAELFTPRVRMRFVEEPLAVSARIDRMGARLADPGGIFAGWRGLSLVSDAIVAGDVQVLGDGTPIVLLRDHQPTGGYPRIATVIAADLDRFVQLRPGTEVRFAPVMVAHAQAAGARK